MRLVSVTHGGAKIVALKLCPTGGEVLVCRLWRGIATAENASAYEEVVRGQVIPGIEGREIPGFLHIDLARRPVPDGVEFLTIMWFESLESVKRFIGKDYEEAHVPAEAEAVLSHFDKRATHFDVLDRRPQHQVATVSQMPNVFAAGDVANAWHPFFKRQLRVEHQANALHQGPAAARAMLGEAVSYDRMPYFFSDQYEVSMEYSGYAPEQDEVVFRGDRDKGEFIAFWLRDRCVVAGVNVNVWDVNEHVQALIRSHHPVEVAALTDSDTPLDSLASTSTVGS